MKKICENNEFALVQVEADIMQSEHVLLVREGYYVKNLKTGVWYRLDIDSAVFLKMEKRRATVLEHDWKNRKQMELLSQSISE